MSGVLDRDPRQPGSRAMQLVFRIRGRIACPRCKAPVGLDCHDTRDRRVRRMHDERILAGSTAGERIRAIDLRRKPPPERAGR